MSHLRLTAVRVSSLLFLLPLLFLAAGPAPAQERDTGRHKPQPVEVPDKEVEARRTKAADFSPAWHLGVNFGLQSGTDLFRTETVDGASLAWQAIGDRTFNSSRFTATFDQDFFFGLHLARDVGPMWSLRFDLGYTRMDVGAEALTGQFGVLYQYDRMDVLNLGLGAEFRLTRAPSHPFLNLALMVSRLDPVYFTELAQTNLGGRVGLGYLQRITPELAVRFEGRLGMTTLDVADFRPPTAFPGEPELIYDPQETLQFFEIMIGIQATFGR